MAAPSKKAPAKKPATKATAKPVKKVSTPAKAVAKKSVSTSSVMPKPAAKPKVAPAASTVQKHHGLTVAVYDLKGKVTENIALPKGIFGEKVNSTLIAQAVRVYLANQRAGSASTKTRGEVQGSTRKIYRQKGTGRARHGGVRAPIFVHGGIAHGPRPHDFSLSLPKKMRRKALFSALSAKLQAEEVRVLTGLNKIEPKTKAASTMLKQLALEQKKRKILLVLPVGMENVTRAVRNLSGVTYMPANQLNTYDVVNHKTLLFMKEALETLEKTFLKTE
jgi:large subunit ribosomal protein L4